MKTSRLDEQDAFRRLQKLASEKKLKLAHQLARMLISAQETFQGS